MARYRHLVFPILEFLQEHQLYPDEQILKFKIELLNKTNMVDYAMDIHKSLHHTEDAPQDMEEAAALLVTFLLNPNAVQELRGDKKYNLQMLKERTLCSNLERSMSALWGKLASEILMQNWDIALEELNRLKDIIDSKLLLGCRSHDSGVSRLAPSETRKHFSKTIRALCNSDVKEGFVFGKDTSLPETYVRYPKKPLSNIGGKSASKRPTVAFFAGQPGHGYVRPILLSYWVIISDNFVPPFFEVLKWESFAVFVLEKDIPNLKKILMSILERRYKQLKMRVKRVQKHFFVACEA
ncbi:hypothetical protein YC2023_121539 [Brassica napus]